MANPNTATILDGPDGPIEVVCGRATGEQEMQCYSLAGAEWSYPLAKAAYLEWEDYLDQQVLDSKEEWVLWCVYVADDTRRVLSTCRTMPRDLIIRDNTGIHEKQGYCVVHVVTDPRYRRRGLSTMLLKHVATWMDGPGNGEMSMLYSSIGDVSSEIPQLTSQHGFFELASYTLVCSSIIPVVGNRFGASTPSFQCHLVMICQRWTGKIFPVHDG
jgi:GNAT superfamily N-acetyltransferase